MKEYLKPYIEDEEIELEDVIALSLNDANNGVGNVEEDGDEGDVSSIFGA